jgi:hypothetical protein
VGGEFATLLGVRRGDAPAIDAAISGIGDVKKKPADRVRLIRALGDVRAKPGQSVPLLLKIAGSAGDESVRTSSIAALSKFEDAAIGADVVKVYGDLPANAQAAAQTLLASRLEWARQLLKALDTGTIKARSIDPGTVDKLRLYDDTEVKRLVAAQFPGTPSTAAELEEKIARMAKTIRSGGGQPMAGKQLFYGKVGCANCHTVFNKGGHIGPEIREGFENYLIVTRDGRTLDGFKVDEDNKVFVLRGIDGQNNVIPLDQIKARKVSAKSLMPEGLLDGLSDQELKDLFAFLKSTTPPM